MLTLKSLRERMRKANPKAECSIKFYGESVSLRWEGDGYTYSLSFGLYELSVANKNFQRRMFDIEKEMTK